jgi:hypothetical protein
LREAARRLFRFHAFRRLLSVGVLIFIDASALAAGVLASAYLTGVNEEIVAAYLPIVLAVGIALFAAQDLYDRAAARRNPAALVGALMLWSGLLVIGRLFILGVGSGWVLSCSRAPGAGMSGTLRFLYEQGWSGSTAAARSGCRRSSSVRKRTGNA